MLQKVQKLPKRSDPALSVRLSTVPRARALVSPRAGPWVTVVPLTAAHQSDKVHYVLPHEHWTDMA